MRRKGKITGVLEKGTKREKKMQLAASQNNGGFLGATKTRGGSDYTLVPGLSSFSIVSSSGIVGR